MGEPLLAADAVPEGPVLVSVEYRARPGLEDELMAALQHTRFSRRRTGATSWRAWQDANDLGRILDSSSCRPGRNTFASTSA